MAQEQIKRETQIETPYPAPEYAINSYLPALYSHWLVDGLSAPLAEIGCYDIEVYRDESEVYLLRWTFFCPWQTYLYTAYWFGVNYNINRFDPGGSFTATFGNIESLIAWLEVDT